MKFSVVKNKRPIILPGIKRFNPFGFDALWAYQPSVIYHKKKFYLFYTGRNMSISRLGMGINDNIGFAISSDLKTWKKMNGTIIKTGKNSDWDSEFLAHCFVFKDGNTFKMLYDGSRKGTWLEEIGLTVSKDLVSWKKERKNPIFKVGSNWWEKRHVSRCCVFKDKGIYYLYYAGHDGQRERIGMAKGKNLLALKRVFRNPVLDIGKKGAWDETSISDPRVIKHKNYYLMFYSGVDTKNVERMGVAISRNLISWKKYERNPILDVSENGWDKTSTARADIRVFDGKIFIFYSGRRSFFYNIGMAILTIL